MASGERWLGHEGVVRDPLEVGGGRWGLTRESGFSQRRGSGREEWQWRCGPEIDAVGGLVGKLHGVTLVLAED
jgi:hypothetical protein